MLDLKPPHVGQIEGSKENIWNRTKIWALDLQTK